MLVFPKPYADAVAKLRVPSGFLIVAVFAWLSHPTPGSLALGLPVSVAGLALRAWAAGCLAKNQNLATGGPFAYTRNPLYLGTLLVAAGLVIAGRNPALAVLFAAVFLFVYLPVIQNEEQHLRQLFPGYAAYADAVPALVPRLTPWAPAAPRPGQHRQGEREQDERWPRGRRQDEPDSQKSPNPFQWSLYLRNQEYNAGAGFAAGMLFLLWKL